MKPSELERLEHIGWRVNAHVRGVSLGRNGPWVPGVEGPVQRSGPGMLSTYAGLVLPGLVRFWRRCFMAALRLWRRCLVRGSQFLTSSVLRYGMFSLQVFREHFLATEMQSGASLSVFQRATTEGEAAHPEPSIHRGGVVAHSSGPVFREIPVAQE